MNTTQDAMKIHESYIVKIFHRTGGESPLMIGEVVVPYGKNSHPFRTAQELWWILLTETGEADIAVDPGPDTP